MRFFIHSGNHNNSNGIGDTVMLLKNALQDCGHQACISHRIEPGAVNLVLEHFIEERHLRALLEGHAAGARFILIGTEPIIGGTFNGGIESRHWHYGNRDYWKLRFDAFKVAVNLAEAVWVLAESMVPAYAETFPQLPVRFLPHGWVDHFATVRQRPEAERDIDFYFSGSLTEHRQGILQALARDHVVVHNDQNTPEYLRQDHLSRAKVCLSLRLSEGNRIPSVSRMHFHLQNRSFLVHEAYELPCPLDPFVLAAKTEDLVPWALAALQLPNRREIADGVHEQFKAALPMTRLLPPLLDEALQRLDGPLARAA
ncbi:MAG: hypothetical protein KF788_16650 [Piscinibacter sp.]|nr:hypothetical protein [Piscinibacter sp.]